MPGKGSRREPRWPGTRKQLPEELQRSATIPDPGAGAKAVFLHPNTRAKPLPMGWSVLLLSELEAGVAEGEKQALNEHNHQSA